MANHCRITAAAAIAGLDAILDLIDAGGAGDLILYVGSEPAECDDAAGGAAAATLPLDATAYAGAAADAGNKWADAALTSACQDATATGNVAVVTHFRLVSGGATAVLQGTIDTSGADLNLNTTTITAGAQVDVSALEARLPYKQA